MAGIFTKKNEIDFSNFDPRLLYKTRECVTSKINMFGLFHFSLRQLTIHAERDRLSGCLRMECAKFFLNNLGSLKKAFEIISPLDDSVSYVHTRSVSSLQSRGKGKHDMQFIYYNATKISRAEPRSVTASRQSQDHRIGIQGILTRFPGGPIHQCCTTSFHLVPPS